MIDTLKPLIKQFLPFAQERMGFKNPPRLFLRNDDKNANNPLGKTAFYNPDAKSVTLYVTGRHPKDVMRSLSHELVHHTQNCRGDFDNVGEMGEGYAQNDEHLREMEREAYETGNLCFRDWEDSIKSTIYFEHLQKGENRMSIKDWKNKEVGILISEAWGFGFKLDNLNEQTNILKEEKYPGLSPYEDRGAHDNRQRDADGKPIGKNVDVFGRPVKDDDDTETGQVKEGEKPDGDGDGVPPWADKDDKDSEVQEEGAFSPNHYCVHHGGVAHNGATHVAEAISHNYDKGLGRVTHYTMKLQDGTILENVATEDIQVTDASLAEGHSHPPGNRDTGASKDDESSTHKGEEDYVNEDSGEEEGEHYRDNAMHDNDHIKAIEHHLDALKKDRDSDDEHIDERTRKDSPDRVAGRDAGGRRVKPLEETGDLQETLKKLIRNHLRGNKNG